MSLGFLSVCKNFNKSTTIEDGIIKLGMNIGAYGYILKVDYKSNLKQLNHLWSLQQFYVVNKAR